MEAYRIERFGGVDGIVLRSSQDPRPGLKEILMQVRRSSLNYRDLMVLKGGGRGPTTAPARSQRSAKELLG
jgi:NADPH:quinone reductase-like Zn-dependent oxidoreductase